MVTYIGRLPKNPGDLAGMLLSHIETKQKLSVYFSRKFTGTFCDLDKGLDYIWYQRYHFYEEFFPTDKPKSEPKL